MEQLSIWWVGIQKLCYRCRTRRPLHEFSLRDRTSGARHDFCRSCQAEYRRQHYERNRDRYIARAIAQMRQRKEEQTRLVHEYLRDHPCVDRGGNDIAVLEFDHHHSATKTTEISLMIGRRNWSMILAEIQKCDVRCVNCHRRRTAEDQVWVKRFGEA